MVYVFLVISIAIILLQYKREKNIINLVSLLIAPYVMLIFLNNFFVYKIGFYKVNDNVLMMLLASFMCFFIGSLITTPHKIPIIYEEDNEIRFEQYNIKRMTNVLLIIGFGGLTKLVYLYLGGRFSAGNFIEAEGIMGNGVIGHLLLVSYAIVPIVFLYWLYNKKEIKCLFSVVLVMIVTFSTFIKYNILGLAVTTFIFVLMYKKSALKKGIIVLVSFVVIAFISNYAIGFLINQVGTVSTTFYINHLWLYCSGSIINGNYIFTSGMNVGVGMGYKLLTYLFALPNMFISKLFDTRLFPYEIMNFNSIGRMDDQRTNVLDAIGYLFPSKGNLIEIIAFAVFMVIVGFMFSYIYFSSKRKAKNFNVFICNFMTFFIFFSFFGTFYINSGPWEILVYSLVIPKLFRRKKIVHTRGELS